jgi:hypothetical protein
LSSPKYVIEKRLLDIVLEIPIDTEFTSLYLRDLYINIHGTMSVPTSRQIGRTLSLSNMVRSKPTDSLWIKYQVGEEE